MIPKKIHYCWFGRGEKPALALRCMESWRKFCPDFQIIEWNEDNFPWAGHPYTRYWMEQKKYALVSDYARLWALCEHGGVYFDTDVELIRALDELMEAEAFFGFENEDMVNTGQGCGSAAGQPVIRAMLAEYDRLEPDGDGAYPLVSCPNYNTAALVDLGLQRNGQRQRVAGAEILPPDWMNPYDTATGRLHTTGNTVSIHWYSMSWLPKSTGVRLKITRCIRRVFGRNSLDRLHRMIDRMKRKSSDQS